MSRLDDIAKRITAHLKRFEADPKINAPDAKYHTTPYHWPQAWRAGNRIGIRYVSYQTDSYLRAADAENYLAWLDAGNVGKHWWAMK